MATQEERRTATRAAIVDAARVCFVNEGYDATSIGDIQRVAGVSRGAFYHHFAGKDDVLAAVYIATSADAIRRAAAWTSPDATPFDIFVHGCLAWLEVVAQPDISQILLVDGPAILGRERARTLEEAASLGIMRNALRAAIESGEIEVASVDLTARIVNAVLAEAALNMRDATPSRRRQARSLVSTILNGLRSH